MDTHAKGVEVARSEQKMGHHGVSLDPVYYSDVAVPKSRLLVYRCADAMDKGIHEYYMSSMAKWYASEVCGWVTDKRLQVFGGYGYTKDYDIERMYRGVRVLRILDGATEIHKRLISKYMGVR